MGKKIEKKANTKSKKNEEKQELSNDKEISTKPNTKAEKKESKKIEKKENKKDNKKGKAKENQMIVENESEIISEKDTKILNDTEEVAILEDMKVLYERTLLQVKEKLSPNLDQGQLKKAIKCIKALILKKFENSTNILQNEQEEFIYLNFVLGKLPVKFSMRPASITIPNSLYGSKFNTQVCLIVKDPKTTFKDLGIHSQLPFKLKVVDIQKLKLKFSRFHERRAMLKEYELFLCDSKIYMLLKKQLGKPFYSSKKYPVPIKLDYTKPEEIKHEIQHHVEKTTTFYMSHGPNYSVKISRAAEANEEVLENINDGIYQTISHILKWGVDFEE
jgi:hypothetical protein